MAWNYMQLELVPEDLLVKPMIGPGGLDRAGALAEIQSILDRGSRELGGQFTVLAAKWRRGAVDDTLFYGPFTWTVYEYDADPMKGAGIWLEDYVQIMRTTGLDVQMPKLT